jgi:outer membrane protein OmpA-like peptidoglycan-associated protein
VNGQNLSAQGLGTRAPIASNSTESGRQQNRRVEVIIEN